MAQSEIRKISVIIGMILSGSASSVVARATRELAIPDESHAALTIELGLSGILFNVDHLLVFPGQKQYLVKIPWNESGKNREEKFGKMTDQIRIPLEDAKYPGDWRGAFAALDRIVVWDAGLLQLLVLRTKDYKTVISSTVPLDTLRPAADRAGEPTKVEIEKTRARFKLRSKKIFGSKITGMAEIPGAWLKSKNREFLVSTRISEFPILNMSCQKDDPGACSMARSCFLEGKNLSDPDYVAGVGVLSETREVLIGNSKLNEINIYKYNSCFDMVWSRTLKLPARLPKLSNLHVDSNARLWIVTMTQDSYTDSNLFYWEHEEWKALP